MTAATEVSLFDQPPPRRPKMKGPAALPPGAVTVTITCRVCGTRAGVELSAPAKLCRECAHDLPATRARAEDALARALTAGEATDDAWAAWVAQLPADLAERWQAACAKRTAAETALAKAINGRLWGNKTTEQRVAAEAQARAEVERLKGVWQRTAQNPENPLCAVVRAEASYFTERARLREDVQRWQIALQEIEAAEDAGLPF